MSLVEDSEGIHFRFVPIVKWIVGVCFFLLFASVLAGFFLLGWKGFLGSQSWGDVIFWLIIILMLFGSCVDIMSGSFLLAPLTTVSVINRAKYVEVSRKRVYGKNTKRYHFSQLAQFKSYKAKLHLSQQYFLALVLENRKTIKLKVPIGTDKQETVKLIKKLNSVLRGE
jgi:hypothetical protein